MDQHANPFRYATPGDLHRACGDIIQALESVQTRTPAERRELAERTRMLLLALAQRLHEPGMPETPERRLRKSTHPDVVAEFGKLHARLTSDGVRAARTETIQRAADYVLGRGAWKWLHGQRASPDGPLLLWSEQWHYLASTSDERLADALAALHARMMEARHGGPARQD